MLLRRYGASVQSVTPAFESKALNEVSFRRDHAHSFVADDFDRDWERVDAVTLAAEREGDVHDEVESQALADLEAALAGRLAGLGADEVLLVENESGVDWPKTRQTTRNVVVDGENRLHFTVRIEPALRLGLHRKRA